MSTLPPFRTFVSPYGVAVNRFVSPHLLITQCNTIDNLDIATITHCYWLLSKIIINYSYQINDFPIQNSIILDATPFSLLERIKGDTYGLHKEFANDEFAIATECYFYPGQVFSNESSLGWEENVSFEKLLAEKQPLLWYPVIKNPSEKLSLRFYFKEEAINKDFLLTTVDFLDENQNATLLHSYVVPFLGSSITFRLRTSFPEEISGVITKIEVIPEFFTVE